MTRRFIKLRTQAHLLIQTASVRRTKLIPSNSRQESEKHSDDVHPSDPCKRASGCDC